MAAPAAFAANPTRLPEYPQYTDDQWTEGCSRAKTALKVGPWNQLNRRGKQIACAARIEIANQGLNRAGQAPAGSPGRGLGVPGDPEGPGDPGSGDPGSAGRRSRRRKGKKTRKTRRHTRRAYF